MKNIVYFDLETRRSAAQVGGWHEASKMGMSVGVTYSTTKEQLAELVSRIEAMLKARDDIRQEGMAVGFANFGDSALEISVRFYTLNGDAGEAAAKRGAVNFAIMDIVNEMGLSFAFPSRSVYIENVPVVSTVSIDEK